MIDINSRLKLAEQQKNKAFMDGIKGSIVEGFKNQVKDDPENTLKFMFERKEDQDLKETVNKIGSALAVIYKQISKPFPLPRIFQVVGKVEVTKQSSVEVKNLSDLKKYFESLETSIKVLAQAASTAPPPQIKIPEIKLPKMEGTDPKLLDAIENLNEGLSKFKGEVKFPKTFSIDNFPPQLTPQPVTNININALQGFVKTTDNTVGTTAVKLPNYGQLFNRRSVQIYNNSGNTIYIGGSDVTTGNGIPVPASSYSNIIDAGYNMIIYGIAGQGGNDVRVLEVSKDQTANVQE